MTNSHVRNPEKYFDRTVQEWHATRFPRNFGAIDVDLGGYCENCYQWLYIIEAAEVVNKPTGLAQRLAQTSGAVGLLIVHGDGKVQQGARVFPQRSAWMAEPELFDYITLIRAAHVGVWHRDVR